MFSKPQQQIYIHIYNFFLYSCSVISLKVGKSLSVVLLCEQLKCWYILPNWSLKGSTNFTLPQNAPECSFVYILLEILFSFLLVDGYRITLCGCFIWFHIVQGRMKPDTFSYMSWLFYFSFVEWPLPFAHLSKWVFIFF